MFGNESGCGISANVPCDTSAVVKLDLLLLTMHRTPTYMKTLVILLVLLTSTTN